jgi:thiamine-monophosphate kinase
MARAPSKPATIASLGEFGLIDRIAALVPATDPGLVVGIGDDCAAFKPTPGMLTLAKCDVQVEGRHFLRQRISPYELGRRSAAINLSDIGAMGGRPRYALISLALPEATEIAWVDDLYRGLSEELGRFGAYVVGGNLSGSADGIVVDVTLLGEVTQERMLLRSGAHPGDAVLVTGCPGDSALGRLALDRGLDRSDAAVAKLVQAHLTPTPRVREGQAIAQTGLGTSLIDVSDGLAGDLGHICERSNVGARLEAAYLPISPEAKAAAARLGVDALPLALHGGEDYELIVTCKPEDAARLTRAVEQATGTPLAQIGTITKGPGMTLVLPDGTERPLEPRGWDHYRKGTAPA